MFASISNKLGWLRSQFHSKQILNGITKSALWDVSDYDYHMKYVKLVNAQASKQSRYNLITNLDNHLESLWDDHRNHKLDPYKEPHKGWEAINISKNKNKTTIYACVRYAELITDESTDRFYWMASGTSVSAVPLVTDKKLNAENIRVSLKDNGFLFSNQNVVMEHGVFPQTIQTCTIKEFGAFDAPSSLDVNQVLEWHNIIKYSNEYHEHVQGQTYYSGTHSMEQRPSNKE